jgi:hypothetical protein
LFVVEVHEDSIPGYDERIGVTVLSTDITVVGGVDTRSDATVWRDLQLDLACCAHRALLRLRVGLVWNRCALDDLIRDSRVFWLFYVAELGRYVLVRPGTHFGEEAEAIPKPIVQIGDHPILWRFMNLEACAV